MTQDADGFDRDLDALLQAGEESVALLRHHGEGRWAAWVEADLVRVRRGDPFGVTHLLSAFGGSGSLNDVIIHPVNGHDVAQEQIGPVNERLSRLLSQVHDHARRVGHELDRR